MSAVQRAIVVTGASTGIGAATVARFAREGWLVYAGVRSETDAAAAATQSNVRPLLLDVTDEAAIRACAAAVDAGGVPLHAVVCNAGIAVGGPLEFLPVDDVRRAFEVNVFGALAVTQALLPALRATRGRLVFVGSISGRLAVPFMGPYAGSKFALRALVDAWRGELEPSGIKVALIEPSSVKTPIWEKGRASRDRLLGLLGAKGVERYGPQMERLFELTENEERNGMPVERVVDAIADAVTARKPRMSYLLGRPARAGSVVALLPDRLRAAALRRALGSSKRW